MPRNNSTPEWNQKDKEKKHTSNEIIPFTVANGYAVFRNPIYTPEERERKIYLTDFVKQIAKL